jgi:hypothetical protein
MPPTPRKRRALDACTAWNPATGLVHAFLYSVLLSLSVSAVAPAVVSQWLHGIDHTVRAFRWMPSACRCHPTSPLCTGCIPLTGSCYPAVHALSGNGCGARARDLADLLGVQPDAAVVRSFEWHAPQAEVR